MLIDRIRAIIRTHPLITDTPETGNDFFAGYCSRQSRAPNIDHCTPKFDLDL